MFIILLFLIYLQICSAYFWKSSKYISSDGGEFVNNFVQHKYTVTNNGTSFIDVLQYCIVSAAIGAFLACIYCVNTPPVDREIPPVDNRDPPVDNREPPVDNREPPVDREVPVDNEPPPVDREAPLINIRELPVYNAPPPADIEGPPVDREIPPVDREENIAINAINAINNINDDINDINAINNINDDNIVSIQYDSSIVGEPVDFSQIPRIEPDIQLCENCQNFPCRCENCEICGYKGCS